MKNRVWLSRTLAASAATVALAAPTPADALDWFLKIDGIKGEVTAKGHKDEIAIESFSWGLKNSPTAVGTARGAKGSACVSEIAFTKIADIASPVLLANAASGMPIPKAVLVGRKGGEIAQEFLKIELSNVFVSSVAHSGSTETVYEAFELRFAKARVVYTPQDDTGKPGTPVESTVTASTCT